MVAGRNHLTEGNTPDMPKYVVGAIVTVVRDGKRVKVKPNGGPFDFTKEEIEAIDAAGVRIEPYKEPVSAKAVVVGDAGVGGEPVSSAEKPKPKGKGSKGSKDESEVTSEPPLEDEDL